MLWENFHTISQVIFPTLNPITCNGLHLTRRLVVLFYLMGKNFLYLAILKPIRSIMSPLSNRLKIRIIPNPVHTTCLELDSKLTIKLQEKLK